MIVIIPDSTSGQAKKGKAKKANKKAAEVGDPDGISEVDLDEMEFRFLSDRLSGSLTIVSACLGLDEMANGVGIGQCRDLTIHIVGANVVEMLGKPVHLMSKPGHSAAGRHEMKKNYQAF